jgi:hypothetical protein
MKRILAFVFPTAILAVEGACNNVGDCPSASSVHPGGSCNGDYLECPYSLQTPSLACDGTAVEGGLDTSCICTKGTWACPSPVSCEDGGSSASETGDSGGNDGAVNGTGDAEGKSADSASD